MTRDRSADQEDVREEFTIENTGQRRTWFENKLLVLVFSMPSVSLW
jgi:hypothetical protein